MKTREKNNRYYRHGRFAIPADSRAALDFYLRHLLVPHSRRDMLFAPLARQSTVLGRWIFAERGNVNGSESRATASFVDSDYLIGVLRDRLKAAGINPSGELKPLLLGDYSHSARGQLVVFVFDESSAKPLAVAKIGAPAHRGALEREFRTLGTLARTLSPEMASTVPKPLDLFEGFDFTVLLESFLAGSSVHFEMRNHWSPRRSAEGHFAAAFDWLTRFSRATRTRKIPLGELIGGDFEECFRKLRQTGETSSREEAFIDETLSKAAAFEGEEIPLSMLQGDFWTRNVLVTGEKIGVVDWEHTRAEGFALEDAFMFAISYGRSFPWNFGRWLSPDEAFDKTFFDKSRLSTTVAMHLQKICRELGVKHGLLEIFLAVFLARRSAEDAVAKQFGEKNGKSISKEVKPWRNLFRAYATTKKRACFG